MIAPSTQVLVKDCAVCAQMNAEMKSHVPSTRLVILAGVPASDTCLAMVSSFDLLVH